MKTYIHSEKYLKLGVRGKVTVCCVFHFYVSCSIYLRPEIGPKAIAQMGWEASWCTSLQQAPKAHPFLPSSFLFLVVRPGAPSSILAPGSVLVPSVLAVGF